MLWWILKRFIKLVDWLQEVKTAAGAPLGDALAVLGGIAGVASAVLSIGNLNPQVAAIFSTIVGISVSLFIASLVAIPIGAILRTLQTESSQIVPFAHNTFIHIISGEDYVENIKKFYKKHAGDYGKDGPEMVCVCGFPRSGQIADLTQGSVVRALMEQIVKDSGFSVPEGGEGAELLDSYAMKLMQNEITREAQRLDLLRKHERTQEEIHDLLAQRNADVTLEDNELNNKLNELKSLYSNQLEKIDQLTSEQSDSQLMDGEDCPELEIGDCILVRYKRDRFNEKNASDRSDCSAQPTLPDNFTLLFLVNCSTNKSIVTADPNAIIGPESSSLMHCIFDFIDNRKVNLDVLFLPVLGTNRLGNGHQTVIASIVQRFCVGATGMDRTYDLAISVKNDSIKKDNLTLVKLRRYISEVIQFNS